MNESKDQCIYDQLGVAKVINAAGTFTEIGGSLMPVEVLDAWRAAASSFVDMRELQTVVGERIAAAVGVEAALVTGGAASSILLGTAAAVTKADPSFPLTRSRTPERHLPEVLRQRVHQDVYDRQVQMANVRIVDVESAADVQRAVNPRTVMMMAYHVYEESGQLRHDEWISLARRFQLPTLLDAAADTPPVANLSRFSRMGYDLVAISGGKAIRGPQDTGLLLGSREMIKLATSNAAPNEGTVGRVTKVSKEDMVALWAAVERYLKVGDRIQTQCASKLTTIAAQLASVPTLECEVVTPERANHFPHLRLRWDEERLAANPDSLRDRLWHGSPRIAIGRVSGTGDTGMLVSAINLQEGEAAIVGRRIAELLLTATVQ